MLAAENNLGQVFDLMMRHRGDPYQMDATGLDYPKIAIRFRAAEIVDYLRTKGII
jgi:hypothetical protein